MPCRELVELVTDYLEDRLSPADRARFEAHLAECEYCETYLDQMLFHLIHDGPGNRLVSACSREQREFVADFLEYLIDNYCAQIEAGAFSADDILKAHEIWRAAP